MEVPGRGAFHASSPARRMRVARAVGTVWLAALGLLTLNGCPVPPRVSLAYGPRAYTEHDYERIVDRWTRSTHVLDWNGVEERIRVDATYHSWDFRWALAVRQAHDQTLAPAGRDALLRDGQAVLEREHEFFVALYSEYVRWSQLHRNFTAWQVRLVDDQGREWEPSRIEFVRRVGASDRTYFPYVTPWRSVFRIHFPRRAPAPNGVEHDTLSPSTRWFALRFRGPRGTADLRWDLADGSASP